MIIILLVLCASATATPCGHGEWDNSGSCVACEPIDGCLIGNLTCTDNVNQACSQCNSTTYYSIMYPQTCHISTKYLVNDTIWGDCSAYAVHAGTTVSFDGTKSAVVGDVGVSPGTSVTGNYAIVNFGELHVNDDDAFNCKAR